MHRLFFFCQTPTHLSHSSQDDLVWFSPRTTHQPTQPPNHPPSPNFFSVNCEHLTGLYGLMYIFIVGFTSIWDLNWKVSNYRTCWGSIIALQEQRVEVRLDLHLTTRPLGPADNWIPQLVSLSLINYTWTAHYSLHARVAFTYQLLDKTFDKGSLPWGGRMHHIALSKFEGDVKS